MPEELIFPKNLDHISRFLREHGKERMAVELETELDKFRVKPHLASEIDVYDVLAKDVLRRIRAMMRDVLQHDPGYEKMSILELTDLVCDMAKQTRIREDGG